MDGCASQCADAKFVVCNNASYRLLQLNMDQYWKEQGVPKHDYPLSFDLSSPPLHFDEMARSMGVPGVRVEKPWEIGPAVEQALASPAHSSSTWCWKATCIPTASAIRAVSS